MTPLRSTFLSRGSHLLALAFLPAVLAGPGCDKDATPPAPVASAAPPPADPPPATETAVQPPEIIVDRGTVAVGKDSVPTAEVGLENRVAALLTSNPAVEGRSLDFVAMRNAKPSQVVAVVGALQRAKVTRANVKSEARDSTTQAVPLSFSTHVPDCATVAWITKDAAIDVWTAGGGVAKRIVRGLAGPDLTLGLAAIRERWEGCGASEVLVGADDTMTWGLAFDLAESAIHAPGARVSDVVLLTGAVPGRRVILK